MKSKTFILILLLSLALQGMSQHKLIKLNSGWKAKKGSDLLVDGTLITGKEFKFFDWMDGGSSRNGPDNADS